MPKQKLKDKIYPSELRILELLWSNYHCKGAADKLCISVETLYKELSNARKRNNLKTNFELMRLAVEEGLLPLNIKNPGKASFVGSKLYTFSDAVRLALFIANNKIPNFRY